MLLACAVAVSTWFAIGAPAAQAYPPTPRIVTATPSSGPPSYQVTLTATCTPGETVTFALHDAEEAARCLRSDSTGLQRPEDDFAGVARVELTAPSSAGEYRGTVSGTSGASFGSFVINVEAPVIADAATADAAPTLGSEIGYDITWWPLLLAMGSVLVFMVIRLQRPLQLSPHR